MDDTDLSSWTGKPSEKSLQPPRSPDASVSQSDESRGPSPAQSSASTGSLEEITYDGTPAVKATPIRPADTFEDSDEGSVIEVIPRFQHKFYIDVPRLEEDQKEQYEYLPGHFAVSKIMSEYRGQRYLVKLQSDEKQLVSPIVTGCLTYSHSSCISLPCTSLAPSSVMRGLIVNTEGIPAGNRPSFTCDSSPHLSPVFYSQRTVCYYTPCTDC